MDLYEVLGLPPDATEEQIRHQYRELAKQVHPDRNGALSDERFKQLHAAYETLSNPDRRREYDQIRTIPHASAAVRPAPKPPAAPTNLRVIENVDEQVTLAWDQPARGLDGFKIYRGPSPDSMEPLATVHGRATQYTDRVPRPGRYYYCASSYLVRGESEKTDPLSVDVRERSIPEAPTALRATPVGANSIRLTWAPPAEAVDGFGVYRWMGTEPSFLSKVAAGETTYVDHRLEPGVYNYHVTAYNRLGESSPSDWVASGVTDPRPAPPVNFRVSSTTASSATLTWDADPSQVDSFEIYREDRPDATPIARLETAQRSHTETGLVPGTYSYYIAAVNLGGASDRIGPIHAVIAELPRKEAP